jgi:hypothetical protein
MVEETKTTPAPPPASDNKGEEEKSGDDANVAKKEEEDVSPQEEPASVTLRDVQEATPAESEDYKTLWVDIDRNNATGPDEDTSPGMVIPDSLDPTKKYEEEERTVEEDLYHATSALDEMDPNAIKVYTNKKKGVTQADRFAGSAGRLYKRFRKAKSINEGDDSNYRNNKPNDFVDIENPDDSPASQSKTKYLIGNVGVGVSQELRDFKEFVVPQKNFIKAYVTFALFCIIIPSALVGALLYYVIDPDPDKTKASASWWVIFLGCRQVITFGVAKALQFVVVDYWAMHTMWAPRLFGPFVTLAIVQSKGWPFHISAWAFVDYAMLFGKGKFANHWLFYQEAIDMFNDNNPSGSVLSEDRYRTILIFGLVIGFVVTLKRFLVGLKFGQNTYIRYSEKLSSILKDCLLVSKVAHFATFTPNAAMQSILRKNVIPLDLTSYYPPSTRGLVQEDDGRPKLADLKQQHGVPSSINFSESEKNEIMDLLSNWEDFDIVDRDTEPPSISSIVQFRASCSYLQNVSFS